MRRNGAIQATFGRKGDGPGEFRNATDVRLGPDGNLHVLDAFNRRITVLDTTLSLLRELQLTAVTNQPEHALPIADGYVLYVLASDSAVIRISPDGQVRTRRPLLEPEFVGVHWAARSGHVAHDPTGDVWVYAFAHANGWLATHLLEQRTRKGRYLIDRPFPEVQRLEGYSFAFTTRVTPSIKDAAMSGRCLFLIANDVGGASESTIVDVFDLISSRYVRSYIIPFRLHQIAVADDGFLFGLGVDPYPIVVEGRFGPEPSSCS